MRINTFILLIMLLAAPIVYGQQTNPTFEATNVFTPGGDGVNDLYKVNVIGYEEVSVSIFNRHGELVYRYFGLDGHWDGFTHAGIRCTSGVYFAYIEMSNSDGTTATRQTTVHLIWEGDF
jgi:gliding motility-associated-like protein